ncbi:DUF1659 domain-containing protein [Bacillus sp. 03113]|uniref:DUF1659 domain-containing protein n=1 Tax=Bacillus sp. 03113 TaxID=2578211 RepID=UPI001141A492|nr:DUF1659 domain-containing protein [Bacillus sp. 03113]
MAQAILADTKLRITFETGLNEKGEPIFKAKTFSNIKKEATADQLYSVAQAIASISAYTLSSIERNDSLDLMA